MKRADHDTTKQAEAIAYVTYAGELTETVRKHLENGVKREFPDVQDIAFEEDESLIAGFRVSFQDMIIDASVKRLIREE